MAARVELSSSPAEAAPSGATPLGVQLGVLRRFARLGPVDSVVVNREIARHFLDAGRYRL